MLEALKAKIAAKAKSSKDGIKNALEDANIKVPEDEQKKRFAICQSCEEFHKKTEFCRACGCYMPLKTWISAVSCPINKWIKIENVSK